jgi:hypothetical protein
MVGLPTEEILHDQFPGEKRTNGTAMQREGLNLHCLASVECLWLPDVVQEPARLRLWQSQNEILAMNVSSKAA